MSYQDDLQKLLISTPNLQEIFTILRNNGLQEAYLCAGWVRNLVWNNLNQLEPTYLQDNLDIYYKKNSETAEEHQILTTKLNTHHAKYLWDLHNLASPRPHYSKIPQGDSIQEVLTKFPETCSAVGIRLQTNGQFEILAPYGLADLFELKVKPTPVFLATNSMTAFNERIKRKRWTQRWPKLKISKN
ncbi:nucleotidyltransferase family protein [Ligilactobacillus equi]|uniref:Nucleotidyltransferase family protein n=1 Tax=Ligilactobacillus equi DPC 6820 TaxID=1392007 RepID=V7HX37_9LACO|nr:nucleotidyltransferase family protein [Ligilactobacillus equi]ETA74442.1 hypothetical protein LEQ_2115 [Ligilactobacillus equi DPC 6820]